MRLYLDANALIYAVEGPEFFFRQIEALLDESGPEQQILTSQLSRLECRVKPLRDGDKETLREFDAVFRAADLTVLDITREIVDLATEIRAQFGFRAPDSLHLATAVVANADAFVSGDVRLRQYDRLKVQVLDSPEENGSSSSAG